MEGNREIQLDQYDKNMSLSNQLQDGLKWLSPLHPPCKHYQRELVDQLRAKGDTNLYFYDGSAMLGDYYNESTVDGTHPTDLGFMLMADSLYPVLEELL